MVGKAGYQEITIPPTIVIGGNTYYVAAQAASASLYTFDAGASTRGGGEAPNIYSDGFPVNLPAGWSNKLITAGMLSRGPSSRNLPPRLRAGPLARA